jgi:hypothetical protein
MEIEAPMAESFCKNLRQERCFCTVKTLPWFLPISDLNHLVTASVVQEILIERRVILGLDIDNIEINNVAQTVQHSARRLFAILAYSKIGYMIETFLQLNLSDKDLPLICERENKHFCLFLRKTLEKVDCGMDDEQIEDFGNVQKSMVAPVFHKEHTDCIELSDNIVLPFICVKTAPTIKDLPQMTPGAYSEVTTHSIHRAHHDFWECDQSQPVRTQILYRNFQNLH